MCSLKANLRPIVRQRRGERIVIWFSLNSESPPLVKKVVVPEFTLDHMYQSNPVQSKAELEH